MPGLGRGEQWGPLRPNRCAPRGTALMAAIIVAVLVWIAKSCLAVMYNTRSCAHEFIVSEDIQNSHRRHRARLPTHLMTREKTAMFSRPRERVKGLILIEMHRRLRLKYVRCTMRIDGSHKIRTEGIRGQSCRRTVEVRDYGISLFTIGLRTIDTTTGTRYKDIGGAIKRKTIFDHCRRTSLCANIIMTADVQSSRYQV